jgi:cytochrome c oxidase subunit 2
MFLTVMVTALAVYTIAQILRILQLTAELSGDAGPVKDGEAVTRKENIFNGRMMIVFLVLVMAFVIQQTLSLSKFTLPVSASVHGHKIDEIMNVTLVIIGVVFFITQFLLFIFGFRYIFNKERKAFFFPDSHKLELAWTILPTIVLVSLVFYGLYYWNSVFASPEIPKDKLTIQVYGKQFDWTARYAGSDGKLGSSNFRLIDGPNILGIDSADAACFDDVITKELHLPVNTPILLLFNSKEVIHSAWLPHFRLQMNCVPGMTTRFFFVPDKTTEDMRKITGNPKFDYILLCNKICGSSHFDMKMKVVVHTREGFDEWMKTQKTFIPSGSAAPIAASAAGSI